ncbi:complement factor H like 4 precursor [Silurus asotus]|uniref:Complement factor H like 4 n=1 Tax=Silurus asotus TaxID=30991 RepID=A0AAD5FKW0_SILAS|nr:complement factor H like 4 precursor [Silurus asotus]
MESCLVVLFMFYLASVSTSAMDVTDDVNGGPSSELTGCSKIPVVENANVSPTSLKSNYTEGDSLIYNCHRGYAGRVNFTCVGHKWERIQKAECSRRRCRRPPDTPNGQFTLINGTEFVYKATVKYTCKQGYRMASVYDTRTCLPGGWSNHLPVCEEIECPPPETKNNIIVNGLPAYNIPLRYGHRLTFTCNSPGLKIIGPNEIICEKNGKWSGPSPACEVFCKLLPIHGLYVFGLPQNNAPAKFGHKLSFRCAHAGMVLKGNKEVFCTKHGKWSHPFPKCEEITCKGEQLINVIIVNGYPGVYPPYKPTHSLAFHCVNPYMIMRGPPSITCKQDGTWSSPYPRCLVNNEVCGPPPNIQFADTVTLRKNYYSNGERVQYQCNALYTLAGNGIATCAQGIWKGNFECLMNYGVCGPPPNIQFADTVTLRKNYYSNGERVQYQCNALYTLSGNSIATCVQGIWRGYLRCLEPCTVTIEDMDARNIKQYYGEKRVMHAKHEEYITFTCQNRRKAQHNSLAFKQQCKNGVIALPSCQ